MRPAERWREALYAELGVRVRYLHSDIDTLERIEILDLFGCIGDKLFELVRIQFLVLVVH